MFPGEQNQVKGKTPFPKVLCTKNCYNLTIALKVVFLGDAEPLKWKPGVMVSPLGDASFPLLLYFSSTHSRGSDVCKAKGRIDLQTRESFTIC